MRTENPVVGIDLRQVVDGENPFDIVRPLGAFDLADTPFASGRSVAIRLRVSKVGDTLTVVGTVAAWAELECSRCLKAFEENLSWAFEVVFQRATRGEPLEGRDFFDEDLERIPHDTTCVDITKRVREALLLALPTKPLCDQDCQGLCPMCGTDLNAERCSCQTMAADPRWVGLGKLVQGAVDRGEHSG